MTNQTAMAFQIARRRIGGLLKIAVGAATVGSATFYALTREATFVPMNETDPLLAHRWLRKLNPWRNAAFFDCFVRKVPLENLQPGLVDDLRGGGSKLIERFSAGTWGRYGEEECRLSLSMGNPGFT